MISCSFSYNLMSINNGVCVNQRAMYRWMLEPAERDAVLANVAIRNGNKDYQVVAEIACVLSAEELLAMRRAYHNRYKRSLEEDVAANTTGHLRQASHFLKGEKKNALQFCP